VIFTRPVEIKRASGWGRFVEQVLVRSPYPDALHGKLAFSLSNHKIVLIELPLGFLQDLVFE
jgi:hypothetical protein